MKYFGNILGIRIHHFFAKSFHTVNQAENEQIVNQVNDALID